MNIEIDPGSGFCFGVVYAIQQAEDELENKNELYCLGDIVHNGVEVERLEKKGLKTISKEQLKDLRNCKVLIRAHGEPPDTYKIALKNNIELIDASCPVVLRLQTNIKKGFDETKHVNGQVVIFGKHGHAEVNALVGQTGGKAIVVSSKDDLDKIDFNKPVTIFSQTTMRLNAYEEINREIKRRIIQTQKSDKNLMTNDTICRQVSNRDKKVRQFAKKHDIIIFVSGKKSSNGKMLYSICKEVNERTYFVADNDEIDFNWFKPTDSVGICGATSTPGWLMEKISKKISSK